ncbi:conserved hypothetical protein [Mycoplasma haemofelis str. Langford 1]|uniref:Diadenylate cyclase n=2 Tax=Mycoplasma haemofelis TaxID=29501 RepID=F6FJS7_MYCHI|nr:diadenylate cyclase CdaM [Mycoplasma haemofelis]AEG73432.1 hypothetical protein MHF_1192 [Mycoplasma haemofelis Ohio2]CBY93107.1 conserved hypothetical protein [Mycoplasma haemofelis str. Langford 1]
MGNTPLYLLITSGFTVILLAILNLHRRIPNKRPRKIRLKRIHKDLALSEYESFVFQLSYSMKYLSDNSIGALVVIENRDNLQKYVILGYEVKAKLTAEFLTTVFGNKKSALHDGGVIIRNFDIVSVSSYFPVTQSNMVSTFGARHRAASGLTETSDAIALIVSETTGNISYSQGGKIFEIEKDNLDAICEKLFQVLSFYID